MTAPIQINEQHLGSDATRALAEEMIQRLCLAGFDVTYGDKLTSELDQNANTIPDDVWQECLIESIRVVYPSERKH